MPPEVLINSLFLATYMPKPRKPEWGVNTLWTVTEYIGICQSTNRHFNLRI